MFFKGFYLNQDIIELLFTQAIGPPEVHSAVGYSH